MTTTTAPGGAAPAPQRVLAQTGMELRLLLRNGENLLVALGIPVGMLVFFALVPVVDFDEPAVDFLLPGAVTVAVMGTAMVSLAIATGFERFYLVLKRLGATPLRRGELVAAKIAAVLVLQTVQVAVLVGVALALGWPEGAGGPRPAELLLLPIGMALGTAAFAGIGLAMAGRLRATATLALVNATFIVLVLASGLVFPLDSLPGAIGTATAVLPSAALGEVMRASLGAGPLPVGALALLAGWALVACALAAAVFRWE